MSRRREREGGRERERGSGEREGRKVDRDKENKVGRVG